MQTDIWLTESAQPAQCPLCSKPLRASSKTCYACGFSLEPPKLAATGSSVWIDPAVYAYQPPEAASAGTEVGTRTPTPIKAPRPTGSVIWEGTAGDIVPQTASSKGPHPSSSQPLPLQGREPVRNGKHATTGSKSIAKPVHNRRRTYTRSLSQTQEGNVSTRTAAAQSPMWQYESPNFEAGSSLPALSLLIAETPTQPGITLPNIEAAGTVGTVANGTSVLADIDEIDTFPPPVEGRSQSQVDETNPVFSPVSGDSLFASSLVEPFISYTPYAHVDEVDTIPELNQAPGRVLDATHTTIAHVDEVDTIPELNQAPPVRALIPVTPQQVAAITSSGLSSWTAGAGSESIYARRVAERGRRKKRHSTISLNPLDRVRWWLLRPGRIEFMLWLGGTVLLISITCVLLLVTAFSLNWITPGLRSSIIASTSSLPSASTSSQGRVVPTITGTPGLVFTLLDKESLLPGKPLHVHGQGFTPNGQVDFTLDGTQTQLNPPASVQSDKHGEFNTTLALGYGPAWYPGLHLIIARDVRTERLAVLSFTVLPESISKGATATPVRGTPGVGVTTTPTPGKIGSTPTPAPVGQTPVPTPSPTPSPTPVVTPTPSPTPSPTPKPPTPTPTVGITPTPTAGKTATATAGANASPTPSATAAVPLTSTSSGDQDGNLSSALSTSNTSALNTQLTKFAPWLWLPMLFYILSMLMLGVAGVLHKRRQ